MKDFDMAIERARLLLVLNEQDVYVNQGVAILNQVCEVKELRELVSEPQQAVLKWSGRRAWFKLHP